MHKTKIALAAVIWLVLLTTGVLIWKYLIQPGRKAAEENAQKTRDSQVLQETQGTSRFSTEIAIGTDSFSGYALFRTPEFESELAKFGIRAQMVDDNADYINRLKGLETGKLQMALFPIDSLIKASATLSRLPATVIAIIDVSHGADAMVASKVRFPSENLDALNSPETKFVLVGDSPSETMTRMMMDDFDVRKMGQDPFVRVASPEAILDIYKKATPSSPEVYVTWEPYVSKLLENDGLYVIHDSSKGGNIVDSLVVSRDFLLKHEDQVEQVLESYFQTLYAYRDQEKLKKWIELDAKKSGLKLSEAQQKTFSDRLVKGIQWRNTQENFVHFGLRGGSLVHIEDTIRRVTTVLKGSSTIANDPTGGKPSNLFFDKPLRNLQAKDFHPGGQEEKVREEIEFKTLDEKGWSGLVPVGTLNVPELSFARGNATLTEVSRSILDELAGKLRTWPRFYLMIRGNASKVGNIEANEILAAQRAAAALEYLQSQGIPTQRMRATRGEISGATSVTFQVGELPY